MNKLSRNAPVLMTLLFGVLLATTAYIMTSRFEHNLAIKTFQSVALDRISAIERHIENDVNTLFHIVNLYRSSKFVERNEFQRFVNPALSNTNTFQALGWAPKVMPGDLLAHEQSVHDEGFFDYFIFELTGEGKAVRAQMRAEYFPVLYVEPHKNNEKMFGFDLGSALTYVQVLAKAQDSGKIVFSSAMTLGQGDEKRLGVVAVTPVYKNNFAHSNSAERQVSLAGFALGIIDVGKAIEATFDRKHHYNNNTIPGGVRLYFYGYAPDARGDAPLYVYTSTEGYNAGLAPALSKEEVMIGTKFVHGFDLGDRATWMIVAKPVNPDFTTGAVSDAWIAAALVLLFTVLLASYLHSFRKRHRYAEKQVAIRTRSLRDSETQVRAVIENLLDGIITMDEKGSIQSVNPATRHIFGYTSGEVVGKNIKMLMPEPYQSEHDGYLKNYGVTGEKKIIGIGREVEGLRKDGSTFPLDLAVSEVVRENKKQFVGIIRDITERKKVEQMKAEFISTVSHELRTPLTSIRGALGLVLGKGGKELNEKTRRLLETASRNSERLTYLINDILDLEKIEAGQLRLEIELIDPVMLAQQAVEVNEAYAESHNVTLHLVNGMSTDVQFRGDKNRLLQVFANLISNAVKYSPVGAVVELRVQQVGEAIRITVHDQGPGIPADFQEKIFTRFAQADSSDTREKGGSGLGLNISKAIIERHRGTIGFECREGEGTEFFFELPAMLAATSGTVCAASEKKVLICEDDPDTAFVLQQILDFELVSSDIAKTGEQALELLVKRKYDLMLLDLSLPDYDGIELVRKMRREAGIKVPIIVVSGRADEAKKKFEGGCKIIHDWIQKPILPERLSESVANSLSATSAPCILHIEDDTDTIDIVRAQFEDIASVHAATTLAEARRKLAEKQYDLILLDISLPDGSGVDLIDELNDDCPIIIFSGHELSRDICSQVEATLTKSKGNGDQLIETVKQILARQKEKSNHGTK